MSTDVDDDGDARLQLSIAEKHLHPLAGHPDIPPLTDLQAVIAQAILQRGNSCPFEAVYQAVLQRWRLLRRRDGTHYASDCRRAVFMNLRPSAHYPSLFRADPDRAGSWRVCMTLDEAREATQAPPPQDADSVDSDGDIAADARHDALPGPGELVPLTELQTLISEAISSNGGSAPFDFIYDHVCRNRKKLKGRDGQPRNTDAKRAILASLSKNINSQPLFQRDARNPGAWMLGVYNPHYSRLNAPAAATPLDGQALDASGSVLPPALPALPASPAEPADASTPAKEAVPPQREKEEVQVTDLHECMTEAIAASPLAVADAAQIVAFVAQRWSALVGRLAPSFHSTTPEAAVHAALANVPPSLVRKISAHHALYTLGKRGRLWATETGRMAQAAPAAPVHAAPTAYASFAALIRKRCVEDGAVEVNVGEELAASPVDPAVRMARPARPFKRRVDDAPGADRPAGDADAEASAEIEQAEAEAAEEGGEETALTDLQKLIWNGIEAHGGCASFDQVVAEVAKSYGNLRRRDGSPYHSDCRRSVQASLSAHPHHPGRVFVRHATNKDLWMIAPEARSRAPRDLPPQPGGPLLPLESDSSASQSPMSTSSVPPRNAPPSLALNAALRPGPTSSLTDMQKLLIRIIMSAGGAAAFQHIIEQVSRQWSTLKRRDGSSYSSDSVRAVKASLSNNTYSVPIFKRDARNPDLWLVADRSFADAVLSEDQARAGGGSAPGVHAHCGGDSDVSLSVSEESADVAVPRRRTK